MLFYFFCFIFFFSSRRRHTRYWRDWSSDVCSSDLAADPGGGHRRARRRVSRGTAQERRTLGLWTAGWLLLFLVVGLLWVGDLSLEWPVDRKSVVEGKSVDLGGRRIIKKKRAIKV